MLNYGLFTEHNYDGPECKAVALRAQLRFVYINGQYNCVCDINWDEADAQALRLPEFV